MENVTSTAVWGSLLASVFLGAFICVQALDDVARRWRYFVLAVGCFSIATLDFLHPELSAATYEFLRIFAWSVYGGGVIAVMGAKQRLILAATAVPCIVGLVVWASGRHMLATTAALPIVLTIATVAHIRQYARHGGYASGVLAAFTAAMAISCCSYYSAVSSKDHRVIALGYIHWVVLNSIAVVFGWIHLPREIRGRAPVRVERGHTAPFFFVVVIAELLVVASLLLWVSWPPTLYAAGNLLMLLATMVFYFHYRHALVIYTDNVTALLEERTASLRDAQMELARQNDVQALRLAEQERELQAKATVIERQRRLELAAQTAGQAAHDIQNLISPIMVGISQLDGQDSNGRVRQTASLLRRQVEGLLELNGQLLALSRRGRMDTHPVNLGELIHDLEARFRDWPLDIALHDAPWVEGSWPQLSRAVANLVSNAVEARPCRNPHVQVRVGVEVVQRTRRCHLGFLAPGPYSYIQVADTGPGIPVELQDQVFEPFFSRKDGRGRSGSGLGLSIVTAVVDDHSGVLDLQSGPEGTTFTLYIPQRAAPTAGTEDELLVCSDATVLVTDDDSGVRDWYGKMLEDAGYQVLTASSGEEAIEILTVTAIDALLLDMKMSRMSGFDTFFGAVHLRPGIRTIIHSTYVSDKEALALKEIGVHSILQKPASRREILTALRDALGERSAA